jgi:hypothetical protein
LHTSPNHRNILLQIDHHLTQVGVATHLLPEGDDVPYDTLLVGIDGEDEAQAWRLELSFLPGLEEDLEEVSILQCFVPVILVAEPAVLPVLRELLITINPQLPLGSFGLLQNPDAVYWKHNALLHNAQTAANAVVVAEIVTLTGYLLSLFAAALTGVAQGEIGVAEAMQDPHFAHIYR